MGMSRAGKTRLRRARPLGAMQRPRNILILISDEHRRDAMAAAGHPHVLTPNLDGLCQSGVRFLNAYTPSPMCVPARAALATGKPVHLTGHWDSATPYAGEPRSWMHDLRDGGMEVTSIGKLHFRDADVDTGFSEQILPMHVAGEGWTIGLLRDDPPPYAGAGELAGDIGAGPSDYTDYDRRITEAAVSWLCSPDRAVRPWCAFVSLVSPHYPLRAPEDCLALYEGRDLGVPVGTRPDHPEVRAIERFFDYGAHFDAASTRAARAAYFALVTFMDRAVGRILAALDASGQREDTLILYTSDHGEMLGDHGLWTKQVMYEASVSVPLVLSGPGVPAGETCATAVSLLDIAPTLRGAAAVQPGEDTGSDLRAILKGQNGSDRTVFSEYHDGGSTTGAFMVRWSRWKYIHYPGYPPQLFDLQDDPLELDDLGEDPDREDVRREGLARLRSICDPDAVNARAFIDQRRRIAELGGVERLRMAPTFNHTPTQ